jgi:hypothetical protein
MNPLIRLGLAITALGVGWWAADKTVLTTGKEARITTVPKAKNVPSHEQTTETPVDDFDNGDGGGNVDGVVPNQPIEKVNDHADQNTGNDGSPNPSGSSDASTG